MAQRKIARKSTKQRTSTAPSRSAKASRSADKASKKPRLSSRSKKGGSDAIAAGDREVTIDRRRGNPKLPAELAPPVAAVVTAAPKLERRKKVNRRRQIDPTTCERDYTDDEVEFMNAIDEYKRQSGRMFPTCSEVLEVLRGLGYQKLSPAQVTIVPAISAVLPEADGLGAEESYWTLSAETEGSITL